MGKLNEIKRKKKKIAIGLMSGTSADGIDTVLTEIEQVFSKTKFRQLAFKTYPYPPGFSEFLLKNSDPKTARLDEICRLDFLIAELFSDAAKSLVRKAGMRLEEIDFIGSHGQTIQHLPSPAPLFGKNVSSTMQIGNPSVIAKKTGIITVGDFRPGDIAVGGNGAPLVPLFDYFVFRSDKSNRAVLNIGGIANITILPKKCSLDDVIAFDTGPGNMLIDALVKQFFGLKYDKDGDISSQGKVNPQLLSWLLLHPYIWSPPPKSTGRETFGKDYAKLTAKKAIGIQKRDIITTVTEFTPLSIYLNYLEFVNKEIRLDELIVSGGGIHNRYIMDSLSRYFTDIDVITSDKLDISSDAKEAICFALLANETLMERAGNVTGATGARKQTVLGSICLP